MVPLDDSRTFYMFKGRKNEWLGGVGIASFSWELGPEGASSPEWYMVGQNQHQYPWTQEHRGVSQEPGSVLSAGTSSNLVKMSQMGKSKEK